MDWKGELNDILFRYRINNVFHFTDDRNIESIRQHGGLFSAEQLDLKKITVVYPGGNEWSREADATKGVHKYVHLCLRNTHPMVHIAKKEGRIGSSTFLYIDKHVLFKDGVMYSSGVSNKRGVSIMAMEDAIQRIDWEVLYTRTDWNDPDIQRRLQLAEKAEILVPDHIDLSLIRNI